MILAQKEVLWCFDIYFLSYIIFTVFIGLIFFQKCACFVLKLLYVTPLQEISAYTPKLVFYFPSHSLCWVRIRQNGQLCWSKINAEFWTASLHCNFSEPQSLIFLRNNSGVKLMLNFGLLVCIAMSHHPFRFS